ncbi:MAG: hypothetical protein D6814_00990 [Calditrichaeota bacterium]|nr:MAG: hypothetical protein D6814_00990 [Calditrichota bacterium]
MQKQFRGSILCGFVDDSFADLATLENFLQFFVEELEAFIEIDILVNFREKELEKLWKEGF